MGFYLGTSVNVSGTWQNPYAISVNDAGTWRKIKQIYVRNAGTWQSVYEFWTIDPDTTYSSTVTFRSRQGTGTATGSFRWVATTDATFTSKGWWTRTQTTQQDSQTFTGDSGWLAGTSSSNANQAQGKMWIPTKSGTGNSGLISVPTLQAIGTDFGNTWYSRWNYSGEVTSFESSLNSVPADWIV